ncbi:MAG: hypothetical protein IT539_15890 [Bradyrhizobiaceae bacterium]|nr:hypothetical protein [Bradyrhizobiaceae bacterium]
MSLQPKRGGDPEKAPPPKQPPKFLMGCDRYQTVITSAPPMRDSVRRVRDLSERASRVRSKKSAACGGSYEFPLTNTVDRPPAQCIVFLKSGGSSDALLLS